MRALALCVLMAAMVACGGADEVVDTPPSTGPPEAVVTMTEWRFGPIELTVSGGEITLQVRNDGAILHVWALLSTPVETEAEYNDDLVIQQASVESGQAKTISFDLPEPGTYQVVCPIPGHIAQGMVGTLVVVE